MKKILVAGAAGFTGKAIVDVLSPHYELRLFDLKPIPDGPDVIQGDLANYDAVKGAMAGVDAVVNAMMAPNETYVTPVIPFQSNVLGTANLLEAAREAGVKRFVHLSTTAIFAAANLTYLDVDSTPLASGMYSLTKYLQEVLCHNYVLVHGFSIACLRIAGGIVCGRTASYKEGKPLGGEAGEYSEGWICRYDIAEACRLALLANDISFEIFYIGSTPELFARVNIQRTVERLGWHPVYDFQEYR